MVDIAVRSWALRYDDYGYGYKSDSDDTKSVRYTVNKTITDNGDGTGKVTLTIETKTNSSWTKVNDQILTFQLQIGGSVVGSVKLKDVNQWLYENSTYTRTLTANISLDGTTTRTANLRLVNSVSSTWEFNSNTQGGDSLEEVPVGIQQSDFQSFAAFTIPNGTAAISAKVVCKSAGVTHDVALKHSDGTTIATWTGLGEFTSLNLTQAQCQTMLAKMPAAVSAQYTLFVTSKHLTAGTLGTKSRTNSGSVAVAVIPSISSITATEQVAAVAEKIGAYVQGNSRIKLTINGAAAGYGSQIDRHELLFDGQTWNANTGTTGALKSSGTVRATARVYDKRGRMASKTLDLAVLAWQAPRILSSDAYRCTQSGVRDASGTYVRIDRSGSVSSLIVGDVEKNAVQIRTWYKLAGAADWIAATNNTWGATTTYSGNTIIGGSLLSTKSYDVRLIVNDILGNSKATEYWTIGTDKVLVHYDKDEGLGIGKYHEKGVLDVDRTRPAYLSLGINDVRNTDPTPGDFPDYSISTHFNNNIGGWRSGLTFRGWTGAYQVWQLVSGSSDSLNSELLFRNGIGDTWQAWQRILTSAMYGHGGDINADMVDGLHAEAIVQVKTISGYPGLSRNNGNDSGGFRTPRAGLIPYEQNTESGASGLGTTYWPFSATYTQRLSLAEIYYRDFTGQTAGDKILEFTTRDNNVFDVLLGHLGRVWAVEILTMNGGRFVPQADDRTYLGETARRWKAVFSVSGVIQTSGRAHKEHIRAPDQAMLQALLDRAADNIVAFDYRDTDPHLSSQLGLIADDIADADGYELIGTRETLTDEETGETHTEYGLKPLAVASLALYGYRVQRDRVGALERRVAELEKILKNRED